MENGFQRMKVATLNSAKGVTLKWSEFICVRWTELTVEVLQCCWNVSVDCLRRAMHEAGAEYEATLHVATLYLCGSLAMLPSFTVSISLLHSLLPSLFPVWGASFFSLVSSVRLLHPLLQCFHSLQWCVATAFIDLMWPFLPWWALTAACFGGFFGIESEKVAGQHNFGWSLFSGPIGKGVAYAGTGEWCRGGDPWCSSHCSLCETER